MTLFYVTGTDTATKTLNGNVWSSDQLFVGQSGSLIDAGGDGAVVLAGDYTRTVVRGEVFSSGSAIVSEHADWNDLYGFGMAPAMSNSSIKVEAGGIVAGGYGTIRVVGDGTAIANAGTITGTQAIRLTGDYASIVNSGDITGNNTAIGVGGGHALLRNEGSIGTTGSSPDWVCNVALSGVANTVQNLGTIASAGTAVALGPSGSLYNSGEILAGGYSAISMDGSATVENHGAIHATHGEAIVATNWWSNTPADVHLFNDGVITADGNAIKVTAYDGAPTSATIVNAGRIEGDITLANGNDLYDGRQGQLHGVVMAGEGNDTVLGGAWDETIEGGAGNDEIRAGAGDDAVHGGAGQDVLDGGEGTDLLMYSLSTAGVTVNLGTSRATGGDAQGDHFSNFENLWGSNHADKLVGSAGDNQIAGLGGNDTIDGGAGNDDLLGVDGDDVLRGGTGDDTIEGGQGKDVLWGDAGFDTFRFRDLMDSTVAPAGRDVVQDFVQGQDIFDLALIDAGVAAGDQAFSFRGSLGFTGAGGELRYVQVNGNTIVQADMDGDKAADFSFVITGTHMLTADDFLL